MQNAQHPYGALTPDTVIDAVESVGLFSDFRQFPLNSYENRVYQVGIEDSAPLIVKFYRPNRWTSEQIQEEHDVLLMLKDQGVSVATPLSFHGQTLFEHKGFFFSLTEKQRGTPLEAGDLDQLFAIGELIGELHHATESWQTQHRPNIQASGRIQQASELILHSGFLPKKLTSGYQSLIQEVLTLTTKTQQNSPAKVRFIHGDCHRSNLLNTDNGLVLLDFDDCRMGMAVQDLWLHVSDSDAKQQQLSELIEGYESHHSFDTRELDLIDVFMAERHIAYSAWIAERWADPAFPTIFPHFTGEDFWRQHVGDLEEMVRQWGKWR